LACILCIDEGDWRKVRHALFFYAHLPGAIVARAGLINAQRYRDQWFKTMTQVMHGVSVEEVEMLSAWVADALWCARRAPVDRIGRLSARR
jgi:PIN domain nuclease of toxin-antitoxin system